MKQQKFWILALGVLFPLSVLAAEDAPVLRRAGEMSKVETVGAAVRCGEYKAKNLPESRPGSRKQGGSAQGAIE